MVKEKKEPKKDAENKHDKALTSALNEIKERFGEGSIMKLSETSKVNVDAISTGSIAMDLALGVGGMPRGRIIEIYGAESSGKTTLCLHIVAEAQKKGGVCAYIDAEHAMDPDYAKRLGVNIDDLLISQPDSGENALQIVETLVNTKNVDVVVVDSVAALTPQREIEGEIGQVPREVEVSIACNVLEKERAQVGGCHYGHAVRSQLFADSDVEHLQYLEGWSKNIRAVRLADVDD
jgi:recombination protein RecA